MSGPPAVAVVGLGDWGRALLRVVADRTPVPVACHAGNEETAGWLDEHYPGVDRVTDYGDVLADDRVDAVVLATPPATHARFSRRALRAETHVFVEKPLALDAAAAAAVAEAAATADAVAFVGYLFVHHPLVSALRLIHEVDPIVALRATWHKTGSFDSPLVRNLLTHHVAVAESLFGRSRPGGRAPGRVEEGGVGSESPDPVGSLPSVEIPDSFAGVADPDVLRTVLAYDGGRVSTTVDRASPTTMHTMTARTAAGDVLAWEDDRLSILTDGSFRPVVERHREPLAVEIDAFLQCVRTGRRPHTDATFGLRVARILDAIERAERQDGH